MHPLKHPILSTPSIPSYTCSTDLSPATPPPHTAYVARRTWFTPALLSIFVFAVCHVLSQGVDHVISVDLQPPGFGEIEVRACLAWGGQFAQF